jgi:hypothetical protein
MGNSNGIADVDARDDVIGTPASGASPSGGAGRRHSLVLAHIQLPATHPSTSSDATFTSRPAKKLNWFHGIAW